MKNVLNNLLLIVLLSQVLLSCSKKEETVIFENVEFKELEWEDLIPLEERAAINSNDISVQMENAIAQSFSEPAPENTIPALNDQFVKIPGFVVPLEMQGDLITEFLLVPYYGACIHTPPPPKNQLIYVKTQPLDLSDTFLPVWVEGQLKVKDTYSDVGDSGYLINSYQVTLYE